MSDCASNEYKLDMRGYLSSLEKHYDRDFHRSGFSHFPASYIAWRIGALGPNRTCLTACAASTQALGEAFRLISEDRADLIVAGGSHSMITPEGVFLLAVECDGHDYHDRTKAQVRKDKARDRRLA